ncbi:hypothetical protein CGMCC3_g16105 [Colletotrichum fructicola]|nr:uncharacterized protein CGMCC3_g16105 [Colletotrichum fructicola]KAE9567733.1 hypothetical protein CGMCC3_g16105 [Colletotrichum fructicola]
MEMEPRSTAEGEEPRTDDVNVTLTSDPHNDQAQGTEQAHGGHYHPIEATYPSSLHSMKNYERKELEKSTSDGDHNCLDHSGDALEQDDCSSPSVKRAAHMGSINKSDEPSLNTALVPYDRFRVERDEDASKEGLTHFPRFDKEPETYEGSAKLLGKRSLGASFDDGSTDG